MLDSFKQKNQQDIEQCERCGGHVKVVLSSEDPAVIEKILAHLALQESSPITGPVETQPMHNAHRIKLNGESMRNMQSELKEREHLA